MKEWRATQYVFITTKQSSKLVNPDDPLSGALLATEIGRVSQPPWGGEIDTVPVMPPDDLKVRPIRNCESPVGKWAFCAPVWVLGF